MNLVYGEWSKVGDDVIATSGVAAEPTMLAPSTSVAMVPPRALSV